MTTKMYMHFLQCTDVIYVTKACLQVDRKTKDTNCLMTISDYNKHVGGVDLVFQAMF